MAWNPVKLFNWTKSKSADGKDFGDEFDRIYENLLYLNGQASSGKMPVGMLFPHHKHPSLCPPSADFPNLCVSRLHPADSKTALISAANFPPLVPELRAVTWFFGASDAIAYSGFTPGNPTVIQLDTSGTKNADVNDPLIVLLNQNVRYHDSIDFGDAIISANWTSLNLVCSFNGNDYRIIDFDAINRTITIDYDSTSGASSSGTIKIYPHRIRSSDTNSGTIAQFRKVKPETVLASGYQSGVLLNHQMQGFKIIQDVESVYNFTAGSGGSLALQYGYTSNIYPTSDGANGTPQTGKTTRSNQLGTYIYIHGGEYLI